MSPPLHPEHRCLLRHYARVQAHCSLTMAAQAARIDALEAERLRLRMALVIAVSVAAWARRDERLLGLLAHAQAQALLCRATCLGQGLPARRGDACTRTGQPCVLDGAMPGAADAGTACCDARPAGAPPPPPGRPPPPAPR